MHTVTIILLVLALMLCHVLANDQTAFLRFKRSSVGCGEQAPGYEPRLNRQRVFGGAQAKKHSWPWLVRLFIKKYEDGRGSRCGANIIRVNDNTEKSDILVTAAHCVKSGDKTFKDVTAYVSEHYTRQADEGKQEVSAADVVAHEDYTGTSGGYDVAVIKLSRPIAFSDIARPICLPQQGDQIDLDAIGKTCMAAGWGDNDDFKLSTELLQTPTPALASEVCQNYFSSFNEQHMVCAGHTDKKADVCGGDSGGMLACKDGKSWILYGVVSYGKPCENKVQAPGVYTRIASYADWIKSKVRELSDLN